MVTIIAIYGINDAWKIEKRYDLVQLCKDHKRIKWAVANKVLKVEEEYMFKWKNV